MRKNLLKIILALFPLIFLSLTSCIGLSIDIQARENGSARVALEYRVLSSTEAIGRLDGNANWPMVPTGRGDWERTIARIPGASLASFASRQKQNDIVTNVTLEFENTDAMLKFLDPDGNRAFFSDNRFSVILNKSVSRRINQDLLALFNQASGDYEFAISLTVDGKTCAMTVTNGEGKEISPPESARVVQPGRKASLSVPIAEIISHEDGLGVKFSW